MGMFDQVARFVCKLDGSELFQWMLRGEAFHHFRFHSWEDSRRLSLPGQPDRTNDLVALFSADPPIGPMVRAIVEIQTEPDRLIFARLGICELLLLQEMTQESEGTAEPPIFSLLIDLTGENRVEGWNLILGRHSVRSVVLNLKNISARGY